MTDTDLLTAVLAAPGLADDTEEAFSSMLDGLTSGKWPALTEKQRAWVQNIGAQLGVCDAADDPGSANLVSSGKVKPSAKERESLGAFLGSMHRPLKPPTRRAGS